MSSTEKIKFIEFWRFIADELGDSQCLLNPRANHLKNLFASESSHQNFLKDVISQSYARCRCRHLKDTLSVNIVLDILGETADSMRGEMADDLLDIELLEEICWLICQRYPMHIEIPKLTPLDQGTPEPATIISMPNIKIRIANNKL